MKFLALIIGLFLINPSSHAQELRADHHSKVTKLKKEILTISQSASKKIKRQNEFDPQTRRELEPLVKELAAFYRNKGNVEAQLADSVGSWTSVWSDLPYTTAIAAQIYQVLFPTGYYYNISKYETATGEIYTSYLRGAYRLRANDLEIEFTKAVRRNGFLRRGTDLYQEAMLAELGQYDDLIDEENSNGLGRPGTLTTLYADKDIRVLSGEVKENGVPGSLFVLVPQTTVK